MLSRTQALFVVTTLTFVLAACAATEVGEEDTSDTAATDALQAGGPVRVMKMHHASGDRALQVADQAGPPGAKLKYFGGPVIANAKVYAIYWNASVQHQARINAFYPAILNSAHMDWLAEYNTPTQTIGRGSFGGALVDTTAPTGSTVTDAQIQAEIKKLIDAGKLPANDANNLYMLYFPPGVKIKGPQGAGSSCVQFCAYHGTFTKNGKNAYYGVMPDLGGSCASGCGGGSEEDNLTQVSSHELVEAITDAAVGLATTVGPPLAWYDNANGEIGDICNGTAATVAGFTVQLEWSNKLQKCTATGPASTPHPAP